MTLASIYALQSDQLTWYIGSTNNPKRREYQHKVKKGSCGSADIPSEYDWKMVILETCSESDRKEREIHFYNTMKPLYNKRTPYSFDDCEYWTDNRIRIRVFNVLNDIVKQIEADAAEN